MTVPATPLCTAAVLAEERAQWCEVQVNILNCLNHVTFQMATFSLQEEMSNALATMRVDYDQVQIKNLGSGLNMEGNVMWRVNLKMA